MFCNNCGEEITEGSKFCNGCGEAAPEPVTIQASSSPSPTPEPQPPTPPQRRPSSFPKFLKWAGIGTVFQQFVKARLKAPGTADFPFESYRDVTNPLIPNGFRVAAYVDSENSFGGEVRTYYECKVKNDNWSLISLDFR